MGHVCDIGEAVRAAIPFERLSITTYPNRRGIPNEMMEEGMAQRKRAVLELAHPNAAGIDIGYEERYRQRVMHHLAKRAEKLGMQLVPAHQPEPA